jgi:hypothetical protein
MDETRKKKNGVDWFKDKLGGGEGFQWEHSGFVQRRFIAHRHNQAYPWQQDCRVLPRFEYAIMTFRVNVCPAFELIARILYLASGVLSYIVLCSHQDLSTDQPGFRDEFGLQEN